MRAVFMGKDKPLVVEGLDRVLRKGVEVSAVVALDARGMVAEAARARGVEVVLESDVYEALEAGNCPGLRNVDLVLSFVFSKRILKPLIELPSLGCVNFHPAPLPEFRGWGVYNFGIYEGVTEWGVSAHFVDASFDTGDLIRVIRFPMDPDTETVVSLGVKCRPHLLALLTDVIDMAFREGRLPRTPQGEGRYYSRADAEKLRKIAPDDTPEQIERKIRAFWNPPFPGATVEMDGRTYTVINDAILKQIAGDAM